MAEERAGCLGSLQLIAAIAATVLVVTGDMGWLTRLAWAVVAVGSWVLATRNLTNPWRRIDREADRG